MAYWRYSKHVIMMDLLGFIDSSRELVTTSVISFMISVRTHDMTPNVTSDVTPSKL